MVSSNRLLEEQSMIGDVQSMDQWLTVKVADQSGEGDDDDGQTLKPSSPVVSSYPQKVRRLEAKVTRGTRGQFKGNKKKTQRN